MLVPSILGTEKLKNCVSSCFKLFPYYQERGAVINISDRLPRIYDRKLSFLSRDIVYGSYLQTNFGGTITDRTIMIGFDGCLIVEDTITDRTRMIGFGGRYNHRGLMDVY